MHALLEYGWSSVRPKLDLISHEYICSDIINFFKGILILVILKETAPVIQNFHVLSTNLTLQLIYQFVAWSAHAQHEINSTCEQEYITLKQRSVQLHKASPLWRMIIRLSIQPM